MVGLLWLGTWAPLHGTTSYPQSQGILLFLFMTHAPSHLSDYLLLQALCYSFRERKTERGRAESVSPTPSSRDIWQWLLLNILQYTGQFHTTKNYTPLNVSSAEDEKRGSMPYLIGLG